MFFQDHRFISLLGLVVMLVFNTLLAQSAMAQYTTDSLFLNGSRPVKFAVGKNELSADDCKWIENSLIPTLNAIGPHGVILGRSAASPEGPLDRNRILAQKRRDAVVEFFLKKGFNPSRIHFDVVDEEYALLVEMMKEQNDVAYEEVRNIVQSGAGDFVAIKIQLQTLNYGRLWRRIKRDYFPHLRAVRIMAFDFDFSMPRPQDLHASGMIPPCQIQIPHTEPSLKLSSLIPEPQPMSDPRRELLSLQTNLLEWDAYVPQYGWCPMPNVAIEYYPRHGHWTFGASFDCPWWVGDNTNHKYFELRNYQFETRYYFRSSDDSYSDDSHVQPIEGQPAFQRFYLQAYLQNFIYQIGFSAKKGWIGEGLGGGIGAGYVLPISRDGHWRLDFGLQIGYLWTQYDPFVYGKPVYHGGEIDGNYYYNTDLYRKDFVKRMHRYTWFGPARVGITLSYDLLYRRHDHKTPGFKSREKGVQR